MSDLRPLLERKRAAVAPPPNAFDRLERFRRRRQTRQRVTAAVVAMAIASAGFAGLTLAFFGGDRDAASFKPGTEITAANVSQLGLKWSAKTTAHFQAPTILGNSLAVVGAHRLQAFELNCGERGETCPTTWSAPARGADLSSVVVEDGSLFQSPADYQLGPIHEFSISCGDLGLMGLARCPRSFVSPGKASFGHLAAGDGALFATLLSSGRGANASLAAWALSCERACKPIWVARGTGPESPIAYADGHLAVRDSRLIVFDCTGRPLSGGAPPCTRLWQSSTSIMGYNRVDAPIVEQGVVYVVVGGRIEAYALDGCGRRECTPLWTSTAVDAPIAVGSGKVFAVGSDYESIEIWRAPTPEDPPCNPCPALGSFDLPPGGELAEYIGPLQLLVTGDVLFVSGFSLQAFDANCSQSCDPLWTGVDPAVVYGVSVSGDSVYALTQYSALDSRLLAFDLSSGPMIEPLNMIRGGPKVSRGYIALWLAVLAALLILWRRANPRAGASARLLIVLGGMLVALSPALHWSSESLVPGRDLFSMARGVDRPLALALIPTALGLAFALAAATKVRPGVIGRIGFYLGSVAVALSMAAIAQAVSADVTSSSDLGGWWASMGGSLLICIGGALTARKSVIARSD